MDSLEKEQKLGIAYSVPHARRPGPTELIPAVFLIVIALTFSACGGSSSNATSVPGDPQISGNWQFTMSTAGTAFASSPLLGGFLVQKDGTITGQLGFSILLPAQNGGLPTLCNSGTATVTGTISGQSVNLTAVVGTLDSSGNPSTQTVTLNGGTLSSDNSTIQNGTYTSNAGYYNVQNQIMPCGGGPGGGSQDTGTWSATLVPPLTGSFQGFFHSTDNTSFPNQNFPVSGTFTQGSNTGAASATVTGTLLFQDPVTLLNDYPCLTTASVNGTISGNTVLLQIFATNGNPVGQIGQTPGSLSTTPSAVTFDSTQAGYVVHNLNGAPAGASGGGYLVTTKSCSAGDSGNLCLGLNGSNACRQPVTMTPFSLVFPPQLVGSAATSQTVTLTNNSGAQLSGATLQLLESDSLLFYNFGGDFNGVHHFSEQDNCTQQGSISLDPGASCTITVLFSPQESCPWLPLPQGAPGISGLAPAQCPITLAASLTITVPSGSADADNEFLLPVSGTGLSAVVPSVPEIDFGWETLGEASPPQSLTFTNQSPNPITILPSMACVYSTKFAPPAQPRPPIQNGQPMLSGLALAATSRANGPASILNENFTSPPLINAPTVGYYCDTDPPPAKGSGLPNLQISNDTCSGETLAAFGQAGDSCSLQITFVPQTATYATLEPGFAGLDDFLQLNTMWCGDSSNPAEGNCEIDSGRFPVEIKTEPPSSLRFLPSAGMDFGTVLKGTASNPITITIFNDPVDPNAGTVTFASKLLTGSDYLETDTCPAALASNQSCTVTVTFTPTKSGLDPGNIKFTYSTATEGGLAQTIYLRGIGQ